MITVESYYLNNLLIRNRIVMPPMCMYSSDINGLANEFHYTHYETRAIGGVGLIIVEATAVLPNGRISDKDLGLWKDNQIEGHMEITRRIKRNGARAGIQIAHSGRKSKDETTYPVAPSAIAFDDNSRVPHELSISEIQEIIIGFKDAAIRAVKAGYEFIEIHAAHGYLLHEFLSPLSNKRQDKYGGSLDNRVRLLVEIINEVKKSIDATIPIGIRISASDYVVGGLVCDDLVEVVNLVHDQIDIVHVSSGGLVLAPIDVYPGYQLAFSEQIKRKSGVDTIAVGLITTSEMIQEALMNHRCDLVALGRELLRNPYFVLQHFANIDNNNLIPRAYERAFK